VVKDATSLITREKSFIEITYEHPRCINGVVNVHKMEPEVGALCGVGACINTSANGACATIGN